MNRARLSTRLLPWLLVIAPPLLAAHEAALTYNRIELTEQASAETANDRLTATLYAQREGDDPAALAKEVNRAIAWGEEQAQGQKGIQVQTLDYTTHALHHDQRVTGWRVRQSLQIQSQSAERLSALLGRLQARLAVSSIRYAVSAKHRRQVENRLIGQAIQAFTARAKLIAGELDRDAYRLVDMRINTRGSPSTPQRVRAFSAAQSAQAPTLEPGSSTLRVDIHGTIELRLPQ